MTLTAIRDEALSLDEVVDHVRHETAGAIASFLGTVRNHADGRDVQMLEYHVYRPMAEKELAEIARQIEAEHEGVRVACTHRFGELKIGDAAIACAVSSAHRAEALDACRALVDRVKGRVPIWKREHGPDGPYWVGWEDARCGPEAHAHAHDETDDTA